MRTLEEQTAAARQVLRGVFGFDGFRPGQEAAIEALLAGRNVLTVMPTGSGKSLCFQIPALITDGLTVVVSPLVALMQDQVAALRLAGVAADSINSANERADNIAAWRRGRGRRDAATLHGPRTPDDRADAGLTGTIAGEAVRHRRGALHFPMGTGLSAGIRRPVPVAGSVPRGSDRRADGDRR